VAVKVARKPQTKNTEDRQATTAFDFILLQRKTEGKHEYSSTAARR